VLVIELIHAYILAYIVYHIYIIIIAQIFICILKFSYIYIYILKSHMYPHIRFTVTIKN
jgi:hypothetical protein